MRMIKKACCPPYPSILYSCDGVVPASFLLPPATSTATSSPSHTHTCVTLRGIRNAPQCPLHYQLLHYQHAPTHTNTYHTTVRLILLHPTPPSVVSSSTPPPAVHPTVPYMASCCRPMAARAARCAASATATQATQFWAPSPALATQSTRRSRPRSSPRAAAAHTVLFFHPRGAPRWALPQQPTPSAPTVLRRGYRPRRPTFTNTVTGTAASTAAGRGTATIRSRPNRRDARRRGWVCDRARGGAVVVEAVEAGGGASWSGEQLIKT